MQFNLVARFPFAVLRMHMVFFPVVAMVVFER
jgi:hypothetical protein